MKGTITFNQCVGTTRNEDLAALKVSGAITVITDDGRVFQDAFALQGKVGTPTEFGGYTMALELKELVET